MSLVEQPGKEVSLILSVLDILCPFKLFNIKIQAVSKGKGFVTLRITFD